MSRSCRDCDGPETKCPYCHHVHCDDPGCMPVECARRDADRSN